MLDLMVRVVEAVVWKIKITERKKRKLGFLEKKERREEEASVKKIWNLPFLIYKEG